MDLRLLHLDYRTAGVGKIVHADKTWAARPDRRGARPARLPRDRARADARPLPRPRRLRHGRRRRSGGSTVGEALNILEGSDFGALTATEQVPLVPRGVALRVRRPRRVPRRPGVLRRPARTGCCRTRSRPSARALIEPDRRPRRRRPGRRSRRRRRRTRAGRGAGDVDAPRGRRRISPSPTATGTVVDLHVHDRVDRRQRHRRARAGASCSTTS